MITYLMTVTIVLECTDNVTMEDARVDLEHDLTSALDDHAMFQVVSPLLILA